MQLCSPILNFISFPEITLKYWKKTFLLYSSQQNDKSLSQTSSRVKISVMQKENSQSPQDFIQSAQTLTHTQWNTWFLLMVWTNSLQKQSLKKINSGSILKILYLTHRKRILKIYILFKVLFDFICFYCMLVCIQFHYKATITYSFWLISIDCSDSGNNIKDLQIEKIDQQYQIIWRSQSAFLILIDGEDKKIFRKSEIRNLIFYIADGDL